MSEEVIDKVLTRGSFRWLLNGDVCRWCYSYLDMEEVLKLHNLILIERIDEDTAFVKGVIV